jgi:hypothetical protein
MTDQFFKRDTSVSSKASGYELSIEIQHLTGEGMFLSLSLSSSSASKPTLGPTQSANQWKLKDFSPGK